MSENIRINAKRERDRRPIFRFFKFFLWTTGVLTLLTLLSRAFPGATPFSFKHVAIILLCSIPLSILCTFIIEKVGGGLGGILVWGTSGSFNPKDLFRGEIHKIKYSKRMGHFDQALQMVNNLLHEDPDNSEAMLLKAQILWEGFGNAPTAKGCLDRIRELTSEDDRFHRWATSYLKTVTEMEEKN